MVLLNKKAPKLVGKTFVKSAKVFIAELFCCLRCTEMEQSYSREIGGKLKGVVFLKTYT